MDNVKYLKGLEEQRIKVYVNYVESTVISL